MASEINESHIPKEQRWSVNSSQVFVMVRVSTHVQCFHWAKDHVTIIRNVTTFQMSSLDRSLLYEITIPKLKSHLASNKSWKHVRSIMLFLKYLTYFCFMIQQNVNSGIQYLKSIKIIHSSLFQFLSIFPFYKHYSAILSSILSLLSSKLN